MFRRFVAGRAGSRGAVLTRPAAAAAPRVCLAEPLEERLLMALSKAGGGSGLSGTLSTNPTIRQQQLICDPDEPQAGSTSVAYDASLVTLKDAIPGPGYQNQFFTGLVEVFDTRLQKTVLQPLQSFRDRAFGPETGYFQVTYQLSGQAGQMRPPDGFTIVDEQGVVGVDTDAVLFELLPTTPTDAVVRY